MTNFVVDYLYIRTPLIPSSLLLLDSTPGLSCVVMMELVMKLAI